MKCNPSIMFVTLIASSAFKPVLAGEETRTPPAASPISISEVVSNWSAATDRISCVDVEFTRYVYDLTFETTTLAKGRLVCDLGLRQFLSIGPGNETMHPTRKKRSGMPFDVRLAGSERWILDRDVIWEIDDDRKKALNFRYSPPVEKNHKVETSSWSDVFVRIRGINIPMTLATLGQVGGSYSYNNSSLPILHESLTNRFTISMLSDTHESVFLHLVPKCEREVSLQFTSIDVQLSRHTWLPDAIQFQDPGGTKVMVYVFRNRRINDCPERTQDLFNLDLSGYEIQSYDADVPSATPRR